MASYRTKLSFFYRLSHAVWQYDRLLVTRMGFPLDEKNFFRYNFTETSGRIAKMPAMFGKSKDLHFDENKEGFEAYVESHGWGKVQSIPHSWWVKRTTCCLWTCVHLESWQREDNEVKQCQKRKNEGTHATDALVKGTRQMNAASIRLIARCIRRKETSPRHTDSDRSREKINWPHGPNTWRLQPKRMTATEIKSTLRWLESPVHQTMQWETALHKRGRHHRCQSCWNNGNPGQQRLHQRKALSHGTVKVMSVRLSETENNYNLLQVLFYYSVMNFGLLNAPATFQRLMNMVLAGLEGCTLYMDDVVIYNNT